MPSFEGITAPDFSLNAEEKGKLLIRFPWIRETDFELFQSAKQRYWMADILEQASNNGMTDNQAGSELKQLQNVASTFIECYTRQLKKAPIGAMLMKAYAEGLKEYPELEYDIKAFLHVKALLCGLEKWPHTKELLAKNGAGGKRAKEAYQQLIKSLFKALYSILKRVPERCELKDCCEIMGYGDLTSHIKKFTNRLGLKGKPGRKKSE